MKNRSNFIITHITVLLIAIQSFATAALAFDTSEATLRSHYPTAPEQGFAATCPGRISFGWIDGTFFEYVGSDIGDIQGEDPQPAPLRTGYYVGAYQYTLASRGTQKRRDSVIFCYDGDLRPGHPATILNGWIIPKTSPLKSCILTEATKRLVCSQ